MRDTALNVSQLVTEVGKLSKKSSGLYKEYKDLKQQEDLLKKALLEELRAAGLMSAKTGQFTASISQRKNIVVQHEQSVLDWLQNTPDVETDQYIGLKKAEFKTLAMAMLKNTGEIIPGTDLETNESITIRSN